MPLGEVLFESGGPESHLYFPTTTIVSLLYVLENGVTEAALKLQKADLTGYFRGHIAVLDRKDLEQRVCECYPVVRNGFDRLLPARTAS